MPRVRKFDWSATMKRWVWLPLLAATGCSTAPYTNLMDRFRPSRVEPAARDRDREPPDGPAPPGVYPSDKSGPRLGEPFTGPETRKSAPRY